MTFSILVRDPETGEFGSAISSSSPAVAARCVNLRDAVGAVNSQNVTDPRLGPALLDELSNRLSAQEALDNVVEKADPSVITYRQLLVLDNQGRSAVYSGPNALGTFGEVLHDNVAAGGNMLASLGVLDAMVDAAMSTTGPLEMRLLAALEAAVAAGGEEGPVHSAGLSVVGNAGWRITDLRVDWTQRDPIQELGEILDEWMPQRDDYVTRGMNPNLAPSYGVPGDA